jgi:O-acetyl-ADP-ribose deacetylase (regulator of RNase III)
MKEIKGNLITLAEELEFDVIIHGCNCHCVMGAGIAKTIKERYPQAYIADCEMTIKGDRSKLGNFSCAMVYTEKTDEPLLIINAYTQYNWGKDVNYEAIRSVFKKIYKIYGGRQMGFGIPQIGCGLAGGDWEIVSEIIDEEMRGEKIKTVIWDGSK